ncbi:alpha/beta-hydrolase [Macrolepiota fuliginosa MF-IS2]|uniref:Alpha/beta-hydrolase n=1 Tax=Macrolepiota fuliginosa MF-IS2 TaxID=1400762 RepID=A0A9P6C2X8_9AGAR|nr:alpha/beta-hydrolase [Macrolepiota fuliginosa MF-IS2]
MRLSTTFALFLSLITTIYAIAPNATIDLGYAKYQGSLNNATGNLEFLGMRYAEAPTGALRWAAPQLPQATPGIQPANAFPNRCWQAGPGTQPVTPFPPGSSSPKQKRAVPDFSEDCLFLNVVTPASGAAGNLPVVVWIHGGGYVAGSASGFSGTDLYDGNDLVRQAGGGVVAVIIQYRLGVFGFLAGQKVHDGGALNAGLLDQQFALQWVQRHIKKFNGDPNKVTIWGESAGAGSVLQQLVANDGHTTPPLFRAAITSSTFLPSQYAFNDRIPEQLFSEVVQGTGCSSAVDTLACLRQVDVNAIKQVNTNINDSGFFGTFVFVPVVDGHLITERPTQLLRQGKVNGQALLSVTNTFEGAIFVNKSTAGTVETPTYLANLFPEFRDIDIIAGTAQYTNQGAPIDQAIAIMGESIFICPTYFLLRAFGNKGFKGEFAVPPGDHGQDVPFYFPSDTPPSFNNTVFINNFAQSFLNFAMSLDPNVKWDSTNTVPRWARWNEQGRNEMLFNKTDVDVPVFHSTATSATLLERCDFWESVSAFSAQ